jgi:hypothetical protein
MKTVNTNWQFFCGQYIEATNIKNQFYSKIKLVNPIVNYIFVRFYKKYIINI